jgi:hypothetical protein
MGQPRTRLFSQVLEDIKKGGKSWQEIKKERLWEDSKTSDFPSTDLYKIETMLENEENLLNTSLNQYCYTILFCLKLKF